jgi:3-hydroxybutyryl-CoA dehydrogenase
MTEQEAEAMVARVKWSSDMTMLHNVDFVVEAASEDFELKKKIF